VTRCFDPKQNTQLLNDKPCRKTLKFPQSRTNEQQIYVPMGEFDVTNTMKCPHQQQMNPTISI